MLIRDSLITKTKKELARIEGMIKYHLSLKEQDENHPVEYIDMCRIKLVLEKQLKELEKEKC